MAENGAANGHPEHGLPQKNSFFTTLLVDGKAPTQEGLEAFLKKEGHFVLKAESAEEALAMTHRFQPDLILLDSEWKGSSGLALLPDLLAVRASAAVIVLAVTPSIRDAVEAMKMGAVEVLERPLDLKKLKVAIDIQKALFTIHGPEKLLN
jgi:DNA-binding NtrC family response regulator